MFPANSITVRGEDSCYFVSKTRGRGFESRPVFQWSDSNIRIPLQRALLRMLESKDHWQILMLVELWI